jgi:hypothetical protein
MSSNPPQMSASKEAPVDLASTLGSLVEVMAKRLHLTDSKDASPFFLECLPAQVAEAVSYFSTYSYKPIAWSNPLIFFIFLTVDHQIIVVFGHVNL